MYPSSCRMRAISAFNREDGMSTRVCLALTALRIRVSMSAIGSVISLFFSIWVTSRSPAALGDSGHVAFERELPETETAQRELPHVRARAPAQVAAVPQPDLVLWLLLFFRDLRRRCHKPSALTYWALDARNGMPMN